MSLTPELVTIICVAATFLKVDKLPTEASAILNKILFRGYTIKTTALTKLSSDFQVFLKNVK
jgi:hypothetical protein